MEALGGLVASDDRLLIGQSGSQAELYVFLIDPSDFRLPEFHAVDDAGWVIRGKVIEGEGSRSTATLAVLATRTGVGNSIVRDETLFASYETLKALRGFGSEAGRGESRRREAGDPPTVAANGTRYGDALADMFGLRVAFYLDSYSSMGGLERWVTEVCHCLVDMGLTCFIYVLNGESSEEVPPKLRSLIRLFRGDTAAVSAAARADSLDALIVNHVYRGLDGIPERVSVIEVLHNLYFWQTRKTDIARSRERISKFVSVSQFVDVFASRYLALPREKSVLIEHGINRHGWYRPVRPSEGEISAPDIFRITSVANLYPQKNSLLLLRAFELAFGGDPSAHLEFVGSGSHEDFVKELYRSAGASMARERIFFRGSVNRSYLSRIYNATAIFCLPSLYEGYGLASLEAKYFGVPLVLSDTGHGPALVSQGNGVIAPLALNLSGLSESAALDAAMTPQRRQIDLLAGKLVEVREDYRKFRAAALRAARGERIRTIDDVAKDYIELLFSLKTSPVKNAHSA